MHAGKPTPPVDVGHVACDACWEANPLDVGHVTCDACWEATPTPPNPSGQNDRHVQKHFLAPKFSQIPGGGQCTVRSKYTSLNMSGGSCKVRGGGPSLGPEGSPSKQV